MGTALIVGLVLGLMLGFAIGRRWAERAIALYQVRQTWAGRHRYRD